MPIEGLMAAIIASWEGLGRYANVLASTPFLRDESGQDLVEYAIIAGLIAMGAVITLQGFATSISTAMGSLGTKLTTYTS
jgi:pilus assembly protein Flp/PilA